MKIKDFINNTFKYNSPYNYEFSLPNNLGGSNVSSSHQENQNELNENKNVFASIEIGRAHV